VSATALDSPLVRAQVNIPLSVLDLCIIPNGETAAYALASSVEYAQLAESLGLKRFWLAEHHNMPGIASAATAVVIGHVAGATKTIRVGSGGIMLPNHSPLVIAEQFGTLESLYPGRIDLGIGRAPGSDQATTRALRRSPATGVDRFPQDLVELAEYFHAREGLADIRAVPGEGLDVPIWLLGSSLYSARLAAMLGLPFAFASHFAPDDLVEALRVYRREFTPSEHLAQAYAIAVVNVVAAESDEEARRLFTSQQQAFVNLRRGRPGKLPAPVDDIEAYCSVMELAMIDHALNYSFVGSSKTVAAGMEHFVETLGPDELMLAGHFYRREDRLASLERTVNAVTSCTMST
jgi:luciferase family oxidoreductase group 1